MKSDTTPTRPDQGTTAASTTRQIPPGEWGAFLDGFTRLHLVDESERATIEVHSPVRGDQIYARGARLRGLSYDPHGDVVDVALADVDHLIFHPRELWVQEGGVGDRIATLRIVDDDGAQELIHVHREAALEAGSDG